MLRLVLGASAVALMVAGCAGSDAEEPREPGAASDVATADVPDGGGSVTMPANVCELFNGIDVAALIGTAAGEFVGSDDECSVPAADPHEFAQASITIGAAPAISVMRASYEGPAYTCPVVDIEGLGDEAFGCLGGNASSHVVFSAGAHLVVFAAGNNTVGPPADAAFLDAAQQIYESMAS